MAEFVGFRQRLDAVLRTLDVKQVSDFLIAEKQWRPGEPADAEFVMWMMIAGSPQLRDLHEQARAWLVSHGHEQEAKIFSKGEKQRWQGWDKEKAEEMRANLRPLFMVDLVKMAQERRVRGDLAGVPG